MQHKAVYLLFCKFTLHVSGVNPSSRINKTQTTASGTYHIFCAGTSLQCGQASLAMLEGGSWTSTGGCSYSFVYS